MDFDEIIFDDVEQVESNKNVIHGEARRGQVSKLYHVWLSIIQRCCNPDDKAYKRYGGRGITICSEWRNDFSKFKKYLDEILGPKPSPKHTLERINNNVGYEVGNLKWGNRKEQAENRRSSLEIIYQGRTQCLMQWTTELKLPYHTIKRRILLGYSIKDAFEKPIRGRNEKKEESESINLQVQINSPQKITQRN